MTVVVCLIETFRGNANIYHSKCCGMSRIYMSNRVSLRQPLLAGISMQIYVQVSLSTATAVRDVSYRYIFNRVSLRQSQLSGMSHADVCSIEILYNNHRCLGSIMQIYVQ